jgi:hypothetical protein
MKSYAQNNEDVFLLELFNKKSKKDCFFLEFGAWDGIHLSNCRLLFENNWSGCFIELDKERFNILQKNYQNNSNIIVINDKVDPDTKNINKIIKDNKIKEIDVLSIDVDGRDLSIWRSLEVLKPEIVVIEFNDTIPFDTSYEDDTDKSIGNSYLAIDKFAKSINYELIKVTRDNLIYSKKEFNNSLYKPINSEEVYAYCKPLRVGFNNFGEYLFFSDNKLEYEELFKSPMAKSFITFQPIPKFLRKMTDSNGQGGKFLKRFYSLTVLLLLRPILFFKYIIKKILKIKNKK